MDEQLEIPSSSILRLKVEGTEANFPDIEEDDNEDEEDDDEWWRLKDGESIPAQSNTVLEM